MPENNDPIEESVPQHPLDTEPGDELLTADEAPSWPYDPATEGVADEEVQA